MKTIENNKLIAEFMGFDMIEGNKIISVIKYNQLKVFNPNNSWNWLMEVIKECYSKKHHQNSYYEVIYYSLADLNIEAVYNACLEFINWYNNQKN